MNKPTAGLHRLFLLLIMLLAAASLFGQTVANPALDAYNQGIQAFDRDNLEDAIRLFREAASLSPGYADAYREVARSFYYLDEYDEALRYIDQALELAPVSSNARTLKGRILIALGMADEAEVIFRAVVAREPYNSEARIGLGELSLARGNIVEARELYRNTLNASPEDYRILISLAFIYDEQGRFDQAEDYLLAAVESNPRNGWVQYYAGEFYYLAGDYAQAEYYIRRALAIDTDFSPALELLSRVLVSNGRYAAALEILGRLSLSDVREPDLLMYTTALAQYNSTDANGAIRTLDALLRRYPDDESARLLLEKILLNERDFGDSARVRFASYHFEMAQGYMERNRSDAALYHFYRGLQLDPESLSGRKTFAAFFRNMGNSARYVEQLDFLIDVLDAQDQYLLDDREIFTDLLRDTISRQWNVDQFSLERHQYSLMFFVDDSRTRSLHVGLDDLLGRGIMSEMYRGRSVQFGDDGLSGQPVPTVVEGAPEAFTMARDNGSDYYVLFWTDEESESVVLHAEVYLGRTGRMLYSTRVVRTGNDRLKDSVVDMAGELLGLLPLQGDLMRRRFEQGIINLGTYDGLEEGMTLAIIKTRNLGLSTDSLSLRFSADDIIGYAEVIGTDLLVSAVNVSRSGFFDTISNGDAIILVPETEGESSGSESSVPGLSGSISTYERIRRLR